MAATATSKPVVILRKKSPQSVASSQPVQATPEPQKIVPVAPVQGQKIEVKAKASTGETSIRKAQS